VVTAITMKRNQASLTAVGIAYARATESKKPADERICYDPLARHFIPRALYAIMRFFDSIGYAEKRGPGVMDFLVARTRYLDDTLQAGIDRGLRQLVILGAGYDSRAYRFDQLPGRVKVFEVDHPATQQVKVEKIRQLLGRLPDHVVYVPIDFAQETLDKRLCDSGYDPRSTTLFIGEGVTYYLSAQAVDDTLAFVSKHSAPGSSIIFDYTYPAVIDGAWQRGEIAAMRRNRRISGEGMIFGIPQDTIEPFLIERGFEDIVNVTGEDLHRMYFTGPNQARTVAPVYAIVHAAVKA
jgi:methyltransferase (TIGR00027 family)